MTSGVRVPRYFLQISSILRWMLTISQRNAWLPYFDQVNAIIFLAPISCFDERLEEDPRVNRLEDSFILWKAVCSSKLLSRTTLIIFLNKVDVLHSKIASGVMVNRHLPSYGDRPNDTQSVVKCMCATSYSAFVGYYATLRARRSIGTDYTLRVVSVQISVRNSRILLNTTLRNRGCVIFTLRRSSLVDFPPSIPYSVH